jgi:4-amino-4-deoxy-L-arabinose transferase-like glycosyltransferase
MVFALLVVFVPVVVMSFFPDRKERYLLPLIGPMSILAARGLTAALNPADRRRVPPWVLWATFAVIAIGLPVAGALVLKRAGGTPWYPRPFAAGVVIVMAAILGTFALLSRRRPMALVIGGAVVMLALAPVLYFGYRDTKAGRSELRPLAEVVRRLVPDARMYYWRPQGMKRAPVDVSIYLNRPTRWTGDPRTLARTAEPQVLLAQQPQNAPPMEPPPGWVALDRVPRDKDWFLAFVREEK